jgi:hypothetical protein
MTPRIFDSDFFSSDDELPRYLLPEGCSDLFDALRVDEPGKYEEPVYFSKSTHLVFAKDTHLSQEQRLCLEQQSAAIKAMMEVWRPINIGEYLSVSKRIG